MRTAFLMTALTVLLVLVGDYFGGARGMMMMLIISLAMNLFSYWNSDKLVLAQYNAKQVDEKSAPALYKMVQRLAERGNLLKYILLTALCRMHLQPAVTLNMLRLQ